MKKNYLTILWLLAFVCASLQLYAQTGYTLKLEMTGFKDNTKFYLLDLDLSKVVDSAEIKNGKVTFTGKVKNIVPFRVHTIDGKYVVVYLENKPITIKGDYKDFKYSKIEGTEVNNYQVKSRDWQKKYEIERDSLYKILLAPGADKQPTFKPILARTRVIDSIVKDYRIKFIKTEKPTYFTFHELYFLRNDFTQSELKTLYKKFPEKLRTSNDGAVLLSYISNNTPKIGKRYINIEGFDPAGKKHKLSDLAGKYILLDFWASWCVPCREENPALVKLYDKYKSKGFEVVGYSNDANRKSWMEAIKSDQLPWLNISDLKGSYSKGAASYQVRTLPQNFLIDKNGIIVAQNLRGEDLEKKLKEIFKD